MTMCLSFSVLLGPILIGDSPVSGLAQDGKSIALEGRMALGPPPKASKNRRET